jgi:cytochrome b subunit of formate dehydrogenase
MPVDPPTGISQTPDANENEPGLNPAGLDLITNSGTDVPTRTDVSKAKKEKEEFFKTPGEESAFNRSEKIKDVFAWLAKFILIVLSILLLFVIGIRIWHLLLGCHWTWLNEEQLSEIDQLFNYLIVGSLGSSLFKYFQHNIGLKE